MPKRKKPGRGNPSPQLTVPLSDFCQSLVESYAVNDRMNQIILDHLHPDAWRAKVPGTNSRSIAAVFAHMHNIRRKWLRLSAPHIKLPGQLNRTRCTPRETQAALAESALRCSEMLAGAFTQPKRRIQYFLRDAWAKPWPVGAAMAAYMLAHDSHHRGQICMLAHQAGFPLPNKVTAEMWCWERLWKQCGFNGPH